MNSKKLSILYVEDDDEVRIQTSKMLGIYFSDITEAINGKDGLDKFKSSKFDAVFTDINMSVMDGISMIKEIRKQNSEVPIIIFSAYDNTEYFLQTIECGIDGYILKPFRFDEIKKVIEKTILKLEKQTSPKINLIDGFCWDRDKKILYKDSQEVYLSKKETLLFELFSCLKYKVVSSQEIEIEVFNDDYNDNKRVRSLISRLRCKLGSNLFKTVYSQGYKLNLEE